MTRLLHDILATSLGTAPDRVAIVDGKRTATYAELDEQSRRLASGLGRQSIGRNDRVAIYLPKQMETVVAVLGTSRLGGIFVPVNPVLKPAQVAHIIDDSGARVLITSATRLTALAPALEHCDSLDRIVLVDELPDDPADKLMAYGDLLSDGEAECTSIDNDAAAILYTSGSTGKPKGVVLSHRNLVAGADSVAGYLGNGPDDTILSVLPLSFDAGFSQLTTGLLSGARVVLLNYLLPRDVLRAAERHGATGITGVPPLWNQLVALDWSESVAKTMRYIANTGGAMPLKTLGILREQLPNSDIFLMYGLTESFRATFLPPSELDKRPTSMGKAIPNTEVFVINDDGEPCQPGEPGELVHRGALVALGYWGDPERTAERFRPVPVQLPGIPTPEMAVWSGDIVKQDEDGFLYFIGRRDDMIKSSGYRISPTEIEELVYALPAVKECAVVGIPDDLLGQAIVVVYTSDSEEAEVNEAILSACREALPAYMVPSHLARAPAELPRNPNGKIDRRRIATDESLLKAI